MKERIKKLLYSIYNLKLGVIIISLFVVGCVYELIKGIYIDIRYHISTVLFNSIFWLGLFGLSMLVNWFITRKDSKKKNP